MAGVLIGEPRFCGLPMKIWVSPRCIGTAAIANSAATDNLFIPFLPARGQPHHSGRPQAHAQSPAERYAIAAMTVRVRVLVITGSMGAGKTTVMGEVSDLLAARGVRHAALDI